jgi:hypothetical protein
MQVTITIPPRGDAPTISIPFRRITQLHCEIQRDAADPQDPVAFEVEGVSQQNGAAVIVGDNTLMASGSLRVRGDQQTMPGHSAHLRVRWLVNGVAVPGGHSVPFSVCAHPAAVVNGPDCVAHYSDGRVGMYISIGIVADSGATADLDRVADQERVTGGRDQSPLLANYIAQPEIGNIEPAHTAHFDRHRHDVAHIRTLDDTILRGQPGQWSNDQLDIFRCERCGMQHFVAIRNSGYRITRRISSFPPNRLRFSVIKEARKSTVDEWTSGAGPSQVYAVDLDLEIALPAEDPLEGVVPVLRPSAAPGN